jgi:hypothetical protein
MTGEADLIDHEPKIVLGTQLGERPLTRVDMLPSLRHLCSVEIDAEPNRFGCIRAPREQHTGLLEAFPHRGDQPGEPSVIKTEPLRRRCVVEPIADRFEALRMILSVDLAAGEHELAAGESRGEGSAKHEDLDARVPVSEQHHRRRRLKRHVESPHRFVSHPADRSERAG